MNKWILLLLIVVAGSAATWTTAQVWGWPHVITWAVLGGIVGASVVYVGARRQRNN